MPKEKALSKFYNDRYYLFSKYDRGIKIDDEGWYSVTPEPIAKHIASRINEVYGEGHGIVMDGFAGVGGNVIQFARKCQFCIGVDLDPVKVEYTKHNCSVYAIEDKVEVFQSDFLELDPVELKKKYQIDVIFMSPPWGGTGYNLLQEYGLENVFPEFEKIIEKCLEITPNLMIFLPRNTSINDFIKRMLKYTHLLSDSKDELVFDIE